MFEEDWADDADLYDARDWTAVVGMDLQKRSKHNSKSRALLALIFKLIRLRHKDANADTQTFTETQQRLKGRIARASRQATKLLLIQT